jgi:hypothetical protein
MRPVPARTCVGCACGIALIVLGLRLHVADGQVSFLPYLDQWEAEVAGLLGPMAHGTLTWRNFFAPNNEHRVVLTRLLSWLTVLANGEWDNRVMVVVGFVFQAGAIAGVGAFALRHLGPVRGGLVALAALWPALLVCDWENVVSGFQSQFHIMILGSLAAFALLPRACSHPGWQWAVWALALALLGSMASGLFAAAALAAATLVCCGPLIHLPGEPPYDRGESPQPRTGSAARSTPGSSTRSAVGFAAGCLTIAAFGALTRPTFTLLDSLHAHRLSEFISALFAYGAWPLPPNGIALVLLWLPWGLLTARLVRRTPAFNLSPAAPVDALAPFAPFAWCLGLWVLLQVATLAWARAGLLPLVSSRYTEVLAWGAVANAACLMVILPSAESSRRVRLARIALIALWFGAVGGYEAWRSEAIYRLFFVSFRGQTLRQEQRLEAFMRTDDSRSLATLQIPDVPYFAARIVPLMRDPGIASLLPAPLRRARAERVGTIARSKRESSVPDLELSRDGAQPWEHGAHEGSLTRAAAWLLTHGPLIAALGGMELLATGVMAILRRRGRPLAPVTPTV